MLLHSCSKELVRLVNSWISEIILLEGSDRNVGFNFYLMHGITAMNIITLCVQISGARISKGSK